MQFRYYAAPAACDNSGFFSHLPGWSVYDTEGLGTRTQPWALDYSVDRDKAERVAEILNGIVEE